MKLPFKILCVCALFIASTTMLYSQGIDASNERNIFPFLYNNTVGELSYTGTMNSETLQSTIAKANGSQFYDEKFSKATISDSGNEFNVRYNAFLDEMEIANGNEIAYISKKHQTHIIAFNGKNIAYKVLREQLDKTKRSLGYFIILDENEAVALYKKSRKKYVTASSLSYRKDAKFQNVRSSYYIEINASGTAIKLPRNKKELAALFPEKEAKILAYIKSEKLKVRDEEDLKKLINYINSI